MIKIRDLKITLEGTTIIDGIDLHIPKGESMVLLGKNGSGKSVLLKAIAGLIKGYEGIIEINEINMKEFFYKSENEKSSDKKFTLAYVFQKGGLFDSMNVYENVAFGLKRREMPGEKIADIIMPALSRVGLAGSEKKFPSELSGGMQKRVGLARAICLSPDVILYDDPTAGLDPVLSDSIADLIVEITENYKTTSIIVTHDLKVGRKTGDHISLLYGGKLVYNDTVDEFFSTSDAYVKQFIDGNIEGPIDIF